jgi:hypothetical protein
MTTLLWLGLGAMLLGGLAALLRAGVPGNGALRAKTAGEFLNAFGLGLAWPYPGNPWVGLAACLPFGFVVVLRLTGRRRPSAGEDYVLLLGFFALAAAIAQAVMRGGGDEFAERVPSRYAEFFVPWVLANGWCAWSLCVAAAPGRKFVIRVGGAAWLVLLLSGWLAATAETWRGIVLPRMEYQAVPVQLARAFQATGDPRVFAGYPRLLVASQSPETSMWPVLRDPRMRGRLPPSLQPGLPMGWMSTAVRWMCRHHVAILLSSILPVLLLGVTGVCDLKLRARSLGPPEANPA